MIDTTTSAVPGRQTEEARCISVREAICAAPLARDWFSGVDVRIVDRGPSFDAGCSMARWGALRAMHERAANNVVVDYDAMNTICIVSATGTAVRLG